MDKLIGLSRQIKTLSGLLLRNKYNNVFTNYHRQIRAHLKKITEKNRFGYAEGSLSLAYMTEILFISLSH